MRPGSYAKVWKKELKVLFSFMVSGSYAKVWRKKKELN